jgi:methylenetetrahydrofolate--tRNA-(uracil-5-)-methyltransferase
MLLQIADETAVPAGGALAVDREAFARGVTASISSHPRIEIRREEATSIPSGPAIIATGPLTSPAFSRAILQLTGEKHLYFYDAIAPIVTQDSINLDIAYRASRYGRGEQQEGDYINCPLDEEQYNGFVEALLSAERIPLKAFELEVESGVVAGVHHYFEGCLPVEILAQRGRRSLAFGPMRPVGLPDPRYGRRPYALVQLRQDNLAGTLYNLVGFQTNLTFPEQRRVFQMIPGLEHAEFARYGQMHRNTFIFAPAHLNPTLQFRGRENLFFAGQITGIEGYVGNIATGLLAGWNAARSLRGEALVELPRTTMLGALCHYISHASAADFQPMKANYGLLPPMDGLPIGSRRERAATYSRRAMLELEKCLRNTY